MLCVLVGAVLPVMLLAAPPPINKLALFPDKSAWCEAKNITQIVGHSGCEAKSIQNRWDSEGGGWGGKGEDRDPGRGEEHRDCSPLLQSEIGLNDISSHRACLGQCFSYSVPNTFPQSTESLVHCDSCMPAQSMWEIVSTAAQSQSHSRRPWVLEHVYGLQGSCWVHGVLAPGLLSLTPTCRRFQIFLRLYPCHRDCSSSVSTQLLPESLPFSAPLSSVGLAHRSPSTLLEPPFSATT